MSSIVAATVTVEPLVVAVIFTRPAVSPLTVLIDPAAFKLTHADPSQTYKKLSSVSRANWPVNAPDVGSVVTRSTVDSLASFAAVTLSSPNFAVVTALSASAAVAISPAANRIFAPGIVSSLIKVTPLAIKSPTVSFFVSLALVSTATKRSAELRSAPASAFS